MKMLLEVEKTPPAQVQDFAKIEKSLRALKSYGPQSYASLIRPDGSYIQVAGGRVTCVLEIREMPSGKHWRAYLEEPKVPFKGEQTLLFGGGHMKMEPDEVLFIDDVVTAFRSFFDGVAFPENLRWRDMSQMFGGT
ncbi:hypothetical protein EB810_06060 [Altererythrobacter sp. FM1]|uniref:hypothetical protein n=1 Tax=Tsuneonella flava TaxID=2055955 RepID=UPI000C803374|nr:hypothetical protein [Tsuneonella flava]ROT97424.1 hypothetical protein EB810_06060 [Altererythrobacter sp. FM1]